MNKKALITGIYGQDGTYLCALLLSKGYEVVGICRPQSNAAFRGSIMVGVDISRLTTLPMDISDAAGIAKLLERERFDEIYHLAADVTVDLSSEKSTDFIIRNIKPLGVLLQSILDYSPSSGFFYCGSCLMFGQSRDFPQTESTPYTPDTPYGISKVTGADLVKYYRSRYGLKGYIGILFNHESPIQKEKYILRTISKGITRILSGHAERISFRDLGAEADWTFAGDVVSAMWSVMQSARPTDYLIGSGRSYTVRELVEHAFDFVGLNWENHTFVTPPPQSAEVTRRYRADIRKITTSVGWSPNYTALGLLEMLLNEDLKTIGKRRARSGTQV